MSKNLVIKKPSISPKLVLNIFILLYYVNHQIVVNA